MAAKKTSSNKSNVKKQSSKKSKGGKKKKGFNPYSTANLISSYSASYSRNIAEVINISRLEIPKSTIVDDLKIDTRDSSHPPITNHEGSASLDKSKVVLSTVIEKNNLCDVTTLIKFYNEGVDELSSQQSIPDIPYETMERPVKSYLDILKNKSKKERFDETERITRTFDFRSLVKIWNDRTK